MLHSAAQKPRAQCAIVLFGWSNDAERAAHFEEDMRTVVRLGRSMAILRCSEAPEDIWDVRPGPIDVWWQGKGGNGHLMLLLAYLFRSDPDMRDRQIRIVRMLPSEAGREETLAHLHELSHEVRIPCDPVVLVGTDFSGMLHRESANAALIILGLADPREQDPGFMAPLAQQTEGLTSVLFVFSAGGMSLHA